MLVVTLPVGISFFTFMAISYVVDVYRGELEPPSLARFAVFLSFFPHLVAGPIVRASELLPQLERPRDPRAVDTSRAFYFILSGLFFKVVIANYLATHIVDEVFAAPNRHSSLEVLVGVYGYAVQIFADFFGYTNIAIGIALLLGFKFPQNFDSPYTAVSLQDFWRRWHMTLSRWLRDYLYIPLGGNRKGPLVTYRNLMLTMLLGGLWHGAAWTFVDLGRAPRARSHRRALPPRPPCETRVCPEPPDTVRRRVVGRLADVQLRLLRVDLLPGRLVLPRRRGDRPAVRRLGRAFAARDRLGRARDRRRHRVAVRSRRRDREPARAVRAPPRPRPGGLGRRLPDGDRHAGPRRRRPLHLLPLLS